MHLRWKNLASENDEHHPRHMSIHYPRRMNTYPRRMNIEPKFTFSRLILLKSYPIDLKIHKLDNFNILNTNLSSDLHNFH